MHGRLLHGACVGGQWVAQLGNWASWLQRGSQCVLKQTNTDNRNLGSGPGVAASTVIPSVFPKTNHGPAGRAPIITIPNPKGETEGQAKAPAGVSTARKAPSAPERAGAGAPPLCAGACQAAESLKPAGATRSLVEDIRAGPTGKNEPRLLCPPGPLAARLDSSAQFRSPQCILGRGASGSAARPGGEWSRPGGRSRR